LSDDNEDLRVLGGEVVTECKGMGGTLQAVGQVIEACLSKEIIKAKYESPFLSFFGVDDHIMTTRADNT